MTVYSSWLEEKRSAYLYNVLAENEKNLIHKKLFIELNTAAEKQAEIWRKKIIPLKNGISPTYKPDFRTRLIAYLVKCFGTERMHSILSVMKIRGMAVFSQYHNEHRHTTTTTASNLRAAVFGINDGLISNMSLILGLAGAHVSPNIIFLTGIAGLLAGACSMGAGEYVSVRSQREIFEYQIDIEKRELDEYPEEEMEELSLIYQARGVPQLQANQLAKIMIENPDTALNALAREELGLNPDDLISPIGAMISSFLSFAFGAFLPLIPYFLGDHNWNIYGCIAITAIALFVVGMILSLFNNKNPFYLGLRMLLIGAIAGILTYTIGRFIGVDLY